MESKLGNCPDCGKEISLRAESCPQCGCPKPFQEKLSHPAEAFDGTSVHRHQENREPDKDGGAGQLHREVKELSNAWAVFLGGLRVFLRTVFWCTVCIATIRTILFGFSFGATGAGIGLGGGIVIGLFWGGGIGIIRAALYWVRGGPKKESHTPRRLRPRKSASQKKEKAPSKTLFTVQDDSELSGPYDLEELRECCRRNKFSADALVAIRGTNDWHDLFGDWVHSGGKKPPWLRKSK